MQAHHALEGPDHQTFSSVRQRNRGNWPDPAASQRSPPGDPALSWGCLRFTSLALANLQGNVSSLARVSSAAAAGSQQARFSLSRSRCFH